MPDEPKTTPQTSPLLPLHLVARDAEGNALNVRRKPGRPKRIRPAPTADEREYHAASSQLREAHVATDPVVAASESDELLPKVVHELAREAASLSWEARFGRHDARTTEMTVSRRIDALVKASAVLLTQRRLGLARDLSPDDPRMIRVREFFVESVADVAVATMPSAQATAFIARLREELAMRVPE